MYFFSPKSIYNVLYRFVIFFILLSFLLRVSLLLLSISKIDITVLDLLRIFALGFIFDIGVASFIVLPYAVYLLIFPLKLASILGKKKSGDNGCKTDVAALVESIGVEPTTSCMPCKLPIPLHFNKESTFSLNT